MSSRRASVAELEQTEYATGGLVSGPGVGDALLFDFDRCGFGRNIKAAQLEEHQRRVLDYYFGAGTAERMAAERIIEQAAAEKRDAIATGRRREGNARTWYASITWSRSAWYALHGWRGPRR
jgi:hypothetical protein